MHPGTSLSAEGIRAIMNKPEYGLAHVGGTFGDFGNSSVGGRKICDNCYLLPGTRYARGIAEKGCIPHEQNNRVCTNCLAFGRPYCSWTADLSADSQPMIEKFRYLLGYLPIKDVSSSMQGFTQQFISLPDEPMLEDDGSEGGNVEDENGRDDE